MTLHKATEQYITMNLKTAVGLPLSEVSHPEFVQF
jgi:hypothetical protein